MDDMKREGVDVLAIGEVLWDLLPAGAVLGGAPFNFVCRATGLGCSGVFAGRIGRDAFGVRVLDTMKQRGMDTGLMQLDDGHDTGTVLVTLDAKGTASYEISSDMAYDHFTTPLELLETARSAACVYYGTLASRTLPGRQAVETVIRVAGGIKLYDMNLRAPWYSPELVTAYLDMATVVKMNDDEADWLCRRSGIDPGASYNVISRAIRERWELEACIITLGAAGVCGYGPDGFAYTPGFNVTVADTVGAGDACTAGFLSSYLDDGNLEKACRAGAVLGAITTVRPGATAPVTPAILDSFKSLWTGRVISPRIA